MSLRSTEIRHPISDLRQRLFYRLPSAFPVNSGEIQAHGQRSGAGLFCRIQFSKKRNVYGCFSTEQRSRAKRGDRKSTQSRQTLYLENRSIVKNKMK